MPNGKPKTFEVQPFSRSACVLALTEDQQVILVRQFRPGMEHVLLEMPGGGIESDEEPIEGGRRELLEETGYAGEIKLIGTHYVSAYLGQITHDFIAVNCKKIAESAPEHHHGEWTEVVLMDLPHFRNHLRSGQLTDVPTGYLGLDYLELL